MTQQNASDEELLRRMALGDEVAFTELYRRFQAGIFRFALRMSGSKAFAEDVTQEVFLALMRTPEGYERGRGSVTAYLYGIARNQILRGLKRAGTFTSLSAGINGGGDLGADLERSQSIESVRAAVAALPPRYREVVVLCDLEELSYANAAAVLGCAVGTVRSRLHRARSLLSARLQRRAAGNAVNPAACLI